MLMNHLATANAIACMLTGHMHACIQAREKVLQGAEWFVYSHEDLLKYLKRTNVAVIGSGAWACAAARMVAQNTASEDPRNEFAQEVKMWVYEEDVEVRSCGYRCSHGCMPSYLRRSACCKPYKQTTGQ